MKTLILSLLLSGFIHAQNISLLEIFNDHLPDAILNSSVSAKNLVELNLKDLLNINPDLLAYQVKAYEAQYTTKIGVDSRAKMNTLLIKKRNFLTLKDLWVQKQIDAVEKNEPDIFRREGIIEELEKSLTQVSGTSEIAPDDELIENEIKYFSFIAITGTKEKYIDLENYSDKLNILYKNIAVLLNNRFDNIHYMNEDELYSLYNESMGYWYLFDESDQLKYQPFQIIKKIYNEYWSKYSFLIEGLNTVFAKYYILDLTLQYDYTPNARLSPRDKILKNRFMFRNLITMFGGYRIPFSKELATFSYLDILAGVSLNMIVSLDLDEGEILYQQSGSRYGEYLSSKLSYYSSNKIYPSYWIKLQTPISHSDTTKFALIAGTYLGYLNLSGDYNILIEEEIKYSQRTDNFVTTYNGTFGQSRFFVSGYLSLKYKLLKHLSAAVEVSYPLGFSAGLSFVFE
jgi:hypothetical protein